MLRALDRRSVERLRALGRAARERGARAFLVGGSVRDLWLGAAVRDLDVVVAGGGERLLDRLARAVGATVEKRSRFGTGTIRFSDGSALDLARARTESYAGPASLPRVRPGSLREDLARRDFGINAVAVDLSPGRFGRIVDPLNGLDDLRARRLRVLHERSFLDDPTRAFRAVRLAARLDLRIARGTAGLIDSARRSGAFDRLSRARRHAALVLLLEEERLARTVRGATRYRLWETVHPDLQPGGPGLAELRRLEAMRSRHGEARGWVAALGILMRGFDSRRTESLLARLSPRRGEAKVLRIVVPESARVARLFSRGRPPRPSRLHRCCRDLPPEVLLVAASRIPAAVARRGLVRYAIEGRRVRADVRGQDLVRRGVRPGPRVAAGLEAALAAKLDGRARSKQRQLEVALRAATKT